MLQGESTIQVPRDRNGDFEPGAVPKHQSRGLSIERLVISLYAKGVNVSDIEDELRDIYGINLSGSGSIIMNKVTQDASEWQNRPLERLYMVVWMDGIVFKVRELGKGRQQDHLPVRRPYYQRTQGSSGSVAGQDCVLLVLDVGSD